jgi:hypothetical protein
MTATPITPVLGAKSFTCPHCGAIAHQTWYKLFLDTFENGSKPTMPVDDVLQRIDANRELSSEARANLKKYFARKLTCKPFREVHEQACYSRSEIENTWTSQCYSCNAFSMWVADELVFPHQKYLVMPNAEMPDHVKRDFMEAAAVVDISARGAAALLRLCIQKIVMVLGEKGDNLNYDIGQLVEKRIITAGIQKALDVVRVVGNNAVHPGEIDFNDNKAVAIQLFNVVNVIVESTIAAPKHIQTMYESIVPETVRAAIEKRDAPKLLEDAVKEGSATEGAESKTHREKT